MDKKRSYVPTHKRNGKKVKPYYRKKRRSKKRIIGKEVYKMHPVYDENRQFKGWKRKR